MIAQLALIRHTLLHLFCRDLRSHAHSNDARNIVCTGTTLALLCTAVNKRTDLDTLADIHDTDSLWSVDLVTACRKHINIHLIHIDRNVRKRLHRICVE